MIPKRQVPTPNDINPPQRTGWLAVPRDWFTLEGPWGSGEAFCARAAWIDLYQLAAYKRHTRTIGEITITLEPGQVFASIRWLAERWGWSKGQVERHLVGLVAGRLVRREPGQIPGHLGSVLTIVDYATYTHSPDPERDAPRDENSDAHRGAGRGASREGERDKREEDKQKPTPKKPARSFRVPSEWSPTPAEEASIRAVAEREGVSYAAEMEALRDHEFRKARTDWAATARSWMRTAGRIKRENEERTRASPRRGWGPQDRKPIDAQEYTPTEKFRGFNG